MTSLHKEEDLTLGKSVGTKESVNSIYLALAEHICMLNLSFLFFLQNIFSREIAAKHLWRKRRMKTSIYLYSVFLN